MEFNTNFSALRKLSAEEAKVEEAKVEEKANAEIIPDDPKWIMSKWGTTCVYGGNLVAKRDLEIIAGCLNLEEFDVRDHNCRIIRFRDDNRPKDANGEELLAAAGADVGSICVNLARTFDVAIGEINKHPQYSILCAFHRNMIMNILHELYHLYSDHTADVDEHVMNKRDDEAEKWALSAMFRLAKQINVEPAHYSESEFFGKNAQIMLECMDGEEQKSQTHMFENNLMLTIPAENEDSEPIHIGSFKMILHNMSGENLEDPDWARHKECSTMQEYVIDEGIIIPKNQPTTQNVTSEEQLFGVDELIPSSPMIPNFATESITTEVQQQVAPVQTPNEQPVNQNHFMAPNNNQIPNVVPNQQAPVYNQVPNQQTPVYNQVPNTQVAPTTPIQLEALPPLGMSQEQIRDIVVGVFYKCYSHIFNGCGRILNSDVGFNNPEAVSEMAIPLSPEEQAVIYKMDALDADGRQCNGAPTTNGLRGFIMQKSKMPAYKLYINNNGREERRLLIPQNPANKSNTGIEARAGSRIMYILEGNPAVEAELKKQGKNKHFYFTIKNDDLQPCNTK